VHLGSKDKETAAAALCCTHTGHEQLDLKHGLPLHAYAASNMACSSNELKPVAAFLCCCDQSDRHYFAAVMMFLQ
jgi:hypothetical protein